MNERASADQRQSAGARLRFQVTADPAAASAPCYWRPDCRLAKDQRRPHTAETKFIADVHVDRNRSHLMWTEDFARLLGACPGAYIFIGNAGSVGSCPVHNPHYDFNDDALPIGASLFARLVEKKLPRLSTT